MEYHLGQIKNWTYMDKSEFTVWVGFTYVGTQILGDKGKHFNSLALQMRKSIFPKCVSKKCIGFYWPGMVAHTFNRSTKEAYDFQASQIYRVPGQPGSETLSQIYTHTLFWCFNVTNMSNCYCLQGLQGVKPWERHSTCLIISYER